MSTPPTKDEFAALVVSRMRDCGEKGKIDYEAGSEWIFVHAADGNVRRLNVNNGYRHYCAPDSDKNAVIQGFAEMGVVEPRLPEKFVQAAPYLLPSVKHLSYYQFEVPELFNYDGTGMVPHISLNDCFGMHVVFDLPYTKFAITNRHLEKWGTTFQSALKLACDNLSERVEGESFLRRAPGLWESAWKDTYDIARIMFLDTIEELPVQGDAVAFLLNPSCFLIAGAADVESLQTAFDVAESAEMQNTPNAMPILPLVLHDGEWILFDPPEDHPTHQRILKHRYQAMKADYAALVEKLSKTDPELSLAYFDVYDIEEVGIITIADIVHGQTNLLPAAHYYVFLNPDANHNAPDKQSAQLATGSLPRVLEVLSDRIKNKDTFPLTFELTRPATSEQLSAIGFEF